MQERTRWLRTAKAVTQDCIKRHSCLCCFGPDADNHDLRTVAQLTRRIASNAERLIALESSELGATAVLGRQPTLAEAIAVALLVAARIDRGAASEISTVGDVVTLVANRDPEMAVDARGLFRADNGALCPSVWLCYGSTLDECRVRLREESLARCLSQSVDLTTATACGVAAQIRSIRQW